eukprot:CAMPEP_0168733842 /NCGR_PEP_ID=MMETSP0724-20121128/8503_1 /TAXON_ID=265536 /ORGANISM="Amphiprora sp., Strain CCMP467" /LENGTH=676 /DNA_ID=CAMNT_0008780921 /DNA_START=23 /DNA_END=2053 /DNA_ORIENTATION=+
MSFNLFPRSKEEKEALLQNRNNSSSARPAPTPQNTQRNLGPVGLSTESDDGNNGNSNTTGTPLDANRLQAALASVESQGYNNNNNYDRQDSLSTIDTIQTIDTQKTASDRKVVIHTLQGNNGEENPTTTTTATTTAAGMSGGLLTTSKQPSHTIMLGALASPPSLDTTATPRAANYGATTTTMDGLLQVPTPGGNGGAVSSQEPPQHYSSHPEHEPQFLLHHQHQYQQQQQQHEFHYPHPDYPSDPYAPNSQQSSCCCYKWCCLCPPIGSCVRSLWYNPIWHKSFCYGGIDGMLTGAGIVAAFYGTGLMNSSTTTTSIDDNDDDDWITARYSLLLIFSLAACGADALCLALGHVWTERTLAQQQSDLRSQARRFVQSQKSLAKAELVHQLMVQQRLLKIDAMSLADTLEGYPDLLVSALLGEGLLATTSIIQQEQAEPKQQQQQQSSLDGAATTTTNNDHEMLWNSPNHQHYSSGPNLMRTIPSYHHSHHYNYDEDDSDDARTVRHAASEAAKESVCLFLGFTVCAMIPSIVCWCLPYLFAVFDGSQGDDDDEEEDATRLLRRFLQDAELAAAVNDDNDATTSSDVAGTSSSSLWFIQPGTAFVLLLCLVMAGLGSWKSRFASTAASRRQAGVFAAEAVAVLLVGMGAGYGIGWALTQCLGSSSSRWSLELVVVEN